MWTLWRPLRTSTPLSTCFPNSNQITEVHWWKLLDMLHLSDILTLFKINFIFIFDTNTDVPSPSLFAHLHPALPLPPLPSGHHHTVVCVYGLYLYALWLIPHRLSVSPAPSPLTAVSLFHVFMPLSVLSVYFLLSSTTSFYLFALLTFTLSKFTTILPGKEFPAYALSWNLY